MSNIGNIIGGHKANLSNPNTSEESKQHSLEVIEQELGPVQDGNVPTTTSTAAHDDDGKDPMRVAAGLKAALHNPNVSDEAKENVKEHLADMTNTAPATTDDGKDPVRVAAGLKATLHNDSVSDEAKKHAMERLANME